jgi:Na+:H+ antiporter, NhaA family
VNREPLPTTSQGRSGLEPLFGAVVRPILRFFRLEAASGILLLAAAAAALIWANVGGGAYESVLGLPIVAGAAGYIVRFTVRELVNEGLMTLFFFVVGMEIKRELVVGELRTFARAALPAVAALGGMLVPALVYFGFNRSGPASAGWGVPMATDIAFCIGVLMLLKNRVPHGLVVFLTALAIFDDIGGILVIAVFYGHGLDLVWLGTAASIAVLLFTAGRLNVTGGPFYAIGGALLWYAVHRSGIHATISGVVLGLSIPGGVGRAAREVMRELHEHAASMMRKAERDDDIAGAEILMIEHRLRQLEAPLARFIHRLHPSVAYGIMPLFALANSGVSLQSVTRSDLTGGVTMGIALGLLFGKQIGIFTFTLAAVRLRLAPMPGEASAVKLLGASVVGGIGFTVALFIAALAFRDEPSLMVQAKLGILLGSLAAGVCGTAILRATPELGRPAGAAHE